jgi:hypothetical protein
MAKRPVWKSLIEFAIEKSKRKGNESFSTREFLNYVTKVYYHREALKQELTRTYNVQFDRWLKNININYNFITKHKDDKANPKHDEEVVHYQYWKGGAYGFFATILKRTSERYENEGYRKLLKLGIERRGKNPKFTPLGEHLNHTEYLRYVLRVHKKVHMPTEDELIRYMKEFVADGFLRNIDHIQWKKS